MQKRANLDKRVYDMLADWRERDNDAWDSGFLGLIVRCLPWFEADRSRPPRRRRLAFSTCLAEAGLASPVT